MEGVHNHQAAGLGIEDQDFPAVGLHQERGRPRADFDVREQVLRRDVRRGNLLLACVGNEDSRAIGQDHHRAGGFAHFHGAERLASFGPDEGKAVRVQRSDDQCLAIRRQRQVGDGASEAQVLSFPAGFAVEENQFALHRVQDIRGATIGRKSQVFGATPHVECGDDPRLGVGHHVDLAGAGHHVKLPVAGPRQHPFGLRRDGKGSHDAEIR